MIKTFKTLVFVAVSIGLMTSCSTMHEATRSQRTPVEQLLISEAVLRSLPIPPGSSVILDTSGISIAAGISSDQTLLQKIVTGWLGRQGYSVQKNEEKATHRVNVIVQALGTELGNSFFGMPPVRSQIIPFSLPELALYKAEYQTGYVKFYMDIFELPSGAFVQSTPAYLAETYYNGYTVLLMFSFNSTDLDFPPHLGSYRKPNVSKMLK